ncbi:mitochondrial protein with role in iron accumulation [Cryptococcus wingfieldii CBS 7118]|uniref:Mitochondrial protein with role in iron accumulation n=1 Tax=Cryptococcus wingfieldii CBS 7118 TaxID=1295528 RepID=A0A1E3IBX4_9TREE|nr:mitochondrial protein with role in iron accumulation [Cryptococcus wingfieldii CBS 7118]ODN86102.1 mitochondrial protein with role in iron accumulation [Cryptococcus wingfieldii CBS 7118]
MSITLRLSSRHHPRLSSSAPALIPIPRLAAKRYSRLCALSVDTPEQAGVGCRARREWANGQLGLGGVPRVARRSGGVLGIRSHSTKPTSTTKDKPQHAHTHKHEDGEECDHGHDHSHSGIFHTHAHDHSEGAEQLMEALSKGQMDRGTRITLLGLGSNVALTISKGLAGLWMNSASLLAEAGHSLSDLLGDFVTLATWRISRKPATDAFPWGYSKFETFGTLTVSVILVGGAVGIGLHSYHLLLQTLLPYLETFPPGTLLRSLAPHLPPSIPSPLLELFHSHGPSALPHDHAGEHVHSHGVEAATSGAILNPHAAWFALASVVVKEWLYRLTSKVANEEHSPVLKANALHHRADALTSLVALSSILGSSFGGYTFLDPLGGICVSFFILHQGLSLSKVAFLELLDAGVDKSTKASIERIVGGLVDGKDLLGVRNVRGVKSGGQTYLDLTVVVPPHMTVVDSHNVEQRVREVVMRKRKEVREVKIHVHGDDPNELLVVQDGDGGKVAKKGNGKVVVGVTSDFGREGC